MSKTFHHLQCFYAIFIFSRERTTFLCISSTSTIYEVIQSSRLILLSLARDLNSCCSLQCFFLFVVRGHDTHTQKKSGITIKNKEFGIQMNRIKWKYSQAALITFMDSFLQLALCMILRQCKIVCSHQHTADYFPMKSFAVKLKYANQIKTPERGVPKPLPSQTLNIFLDIFHLKENGRFFFLFLWLHFLRRRR